MTIKERQLISKNIIIISGPSGAGEDSVIKDIVRTMSVEKIITTTTRDMRKEDIEGVSYYFISKKDFQQKIKNNEFVEYAKQYNGNYYGVSKKELLRVAKSNNIGIWKIEYQGVITAKKLFPNIKSILITAPLEDLEKRIQKRDNLSSKYVEERMVYTKEWLKHRDIYDFEVINNDGDLKNAIKETKDIIKHLK